MFKTENDFRDHLFENHKDTFSNLIVKKKISHAKKKRDFPPISFLLRTKVERKINEIIDAFEYFLLTAKEVRLEKEGDSTTRVDLIGYAENIGLTIIELKKSSKTERESFTQLLAYANHFCSLFPGLKENSITSVLIAPMETRIVRDAYAQEIIFNNKNVIAMTPDFSSGKIKLKVHYPDLSYYQWFENNLLDDRSFFTIVISFSVLEGWIDTALDTENKEMPQYSKDALNTIANLISQKLQLIGVDGFVYARQKWSELVNTVPYPNSIVIVAINPFSSFRASFDDGQIYGESLPNRLQGIQVIYEQLDETERKFWLENMESDFYHNLRKIVRSEFEIILKNKNNILVEKEVDILSWLAFKLSVMEAVCNHNLDIFLTGMVKEIYLEYVKYIFDSKDEEDNSAQFAYEMLRNFLSVWCGLEALGLAE